MRLPVCIWLPGQYRKRIRAAFRLRIHEQRRTGQTESRLIDERQKKMPKNGFNLPMLAIYRQNETFFQGRTQVSPARFKKVALIAQKSVYYHSE